MADGVSVGVCVAIAMRVGVGVALGVAVSSGMTVSAAVGVCVRSMPPIPGTWASVGVSVGRCATACRVGVAVGDTAVMPRPIPLREA